MSVVEEFVEAIADLKEKEALELVKKLIEQKVDISTVLDGIRRASDIIGKRFEEGKYFISDLVMAGEILKEITEMLKPVIVEEKPKRAGTVVIGTAQGDIHDIGKNIVVAVLEANGFEVIDLGVDVSPEKFVEAIRKYNPQVVGISCLITEGIEGMKRIVDTIKAAGLRDKVKIIIGGGRVDEYACKYVEADGWTRDVQTGLETIKGWVGVK